MSPVPFRDPFEPPHSQHFYKRLDLSQYDAIEIRLKTDGRIYLMQIKTESANADDIYQVIPILPC